MNKYEVSMERTSVAYCTFEVEAHDEDEATDKAYYEAGDHIYSEMDANYDLEHITLKKSVPNPKDPYKFTHKVIWEWRWWSNEFDMDNLTTDELGELNDHAGSHIITMTEQGYVEGDLLKILTIDDEDFIFCGYWDKER